MTTFIRNAWYVAAWDHEVGRTPMARTICGEPVALYRKLDGSVVALHDACPHRLLPLSMGVVEGDSVRCRYHGMLFDETGRCAEMPGAGEASYDHIRVKQAYPVVERYRFVWVWIGEAEKADPTLLPDLWPCERQGWVFDGGVYPIKCDYRLLIDNLMDLTHETYVHPTSIGQPEITETPIAVEVKEQRVYVSRWMKGIDAPPFWRGALGRPGAVDRWQICEFQLPSTVMIDVGVALAGTGAPEGDRSQGVNGFVVDVMSPETETTSWYYWGMARNFRIADQGFTERFKAQQGGVFMEDVEVLEAQQRSIQQNPDMRLKAFAIDAGGVRARVLIDRALKAQAEVAAA